MAHIEQQNFCRRFKEKYPKYFKNKKVLDVGSLNINGHNRFLFENCSYLGLDIGPGSNVDVVSLGHLYDAKDGSFDVIISTEAFEHDMYYEETIKNIMRMLKDGGMFIFTCASTGRPEHGTIKSDGTIAAPLLQNVSNEWANYYKNLTENDIRSIEGFNSMFSNSYFEYNSSCCDLYFFGIKNREKVLNKVVLVNLWFGEIPEYFKYHYETCVANKNVDFLFITDQKIELETEDNYIIINIDLQFLKDRLKDKIGIDYNFSNNRNICQFKSALGDIFQEELKNYLYWGFHDIDTLFGDFNKFILTLLNDDYDIISFAAKNYHDRLSGPLALIKNNDTNNKLYKKRFSEFVDKLYNYSVDSFDETEFNAIIKEDNNIKVKLLYDVCNFSTDKGYPIYESFWSGGKLYINDEEKLIHHFIDKNNTNFYKIGNSISTYYKKDLVDDFYWVTYLTENYENLAKVLYESIYKFSSRKCVVYTVNYISDLSYKSNEQFIFRRIDIDFGEKDSSGRYTGILNLKPSILSDVVDFMPNDNFVYVDTDCYLNVSADIVVKYFKMLDNYPLLNSHIHDRLFAKDESGEWFSTLDVLSEATGTPIIIFPRRKANLMLFNSKSKWIFDEQIKLYEDYKDSRPNIFRLHDEDAINILLSKYNLTKSLPIIDMEESSFIDMNKFMNYSYNLTQISSHAVLPINSNDIIIFHGFKNANFIENINTDHLPSVIEHNRFSISYENNTLLFKRYSFLNDKKIQSPVHFKVKKMNGDIIYELNNQDLYRYWLFYIGNCFLEKNSYIIQIEDNLNNIIFNKIIKI
jgi:SAM-dependent methyltransferase